jgi:CsoR family transcriptional regulator, copper-sensing transcriptional repressor
MTETDKAAVLQRLKSIQGHIGGIIRMAEQDTYCIDQLQQIQAVQGALDKVAEAILENHLSTCLVAAVRGDDPQEREQVLAEIAEVFRARRRT